MIKFVVSLVVRYKDEILLLRRARNFQEIDFGKGLWELPGGGMKLTTPLKHTAKIELMEETGIQTNKSLKYQSVMYYTLKTPRRTARRVNFVVHLRLKKKPDVVLSEEHDKYAWVKTRKEIRSAEMVPKIQQLLLDKYLPKKDS
jgi:8-oxo-dGTP pyrophosphatase MutT (NUDIX family)